MALILISGPINSGKTTVANAIQALLPQTAHIEIDSLREFIAWMPLEEAIPLNLENAALSARTFLEKGLNVVVSYPLLKAQYESFSDAVKDLTKDIFFFSLNLPLDEALKNRGQRELSEWETERIKYHYEMRLNDPGFGITVYTGGKTPENVAREIIGLINTGQR